jgi:hypothetical protein
LKPVDKKVPFLADFRSKTNFWLNFPLLETLPSPFESQFIAHWAREKRHLGFRQVWACLSAVSVPVLLQFTGKDPGWGWSRDTPESGVFSISVLKTVREEWQGNYCRCCQM